MPPLLVASCVMKVGGVRCEPFLSFVTNEAGH